MAVTALALSVAGTAMSGPSKGTLGKDDAASLFNACKTTATSTTSAVRNPPLGNGSGATTIMWCGVVDREGQLVLIEATDTGGTPQNPKGSDAWRGSIEIAEAKAYTAMAFSSSQQAIDSRTLGLLARSDFSLPNPPCPSVTGPGTDCGPASLFGIGDTNPFRAPGGGSGGDGIGKEHHGIVTFAGGQPVYDCKSHALLGAIGVSGDGVDEDDAVAKGAVSGAGFCTTP